MHRELPITKIVFYKDSYWYFALGLGLVFWVFYGAFIGNFQPIQLHEAGKVLLFNVLIYPVLEELIFRGWLQTHLYQKKKFSVSIIGISNANLLTSCLFALFHLFNQTWYWSFLIFFPSLVFGFFRDRYEQVMPCILLHAFYNFGLVCFFYNQN